MIERWFCFFRSRLSVALTLLSASVLFEIGDTLFGGINQQRNFVFEVHSLGRDLSYAINIFEVVLLVCNFDV